MARAILEGAPVSAGVAIGPLKIMGASCLYEKRSIAEDEIEGEIAAIKDASEKVRANLRKTMERIPPNLAEYREIVSAQMELARDPKIIQSVANRIRHLKICAAWALSVTIDELVALFYGMDNDYLRERTQDIRAIGHALARALPGRETTTDMCESGDVVAAQDVSPAEMTEFSSLGLITVDGGPTSHTAILARGLKAPAVVGVARLFEFARQGETVIVDGLSGVVIFGPDEDDLARYGQIRDNYLRFTQKAAIDASLPAITMDGKTIGVYANLESPDDARDLDRYGAEGVGLYRTEFSFLNDQPPTEDELTAEYTKILRAGKPVVFRVLDVGADKTLPPGEGPREPNPALGVRGIRFCFKRRDIFRRQLRAILRAAAEGEASILLPMITAPWEIKATRLLIEELERELDNEGLPRGRNLPLGAMIETPAAALICDMIAGECDFLSVGTNDLAHYLLAIDRNNSQVAHLYDPLHPAFLRALSRAVSLAGKKGVKISVCGELAADPLGVPLLVGLGVDSLSASPAYIPAIKHIIRDLDAGKTGELIREALEKDDFCQVKKNFRDTLSAFLDAGVVPHNTILPPYNRL